MYNHENTEQIEYCALCDCKMYKDDVYEDIKYIDGLGYICEQCYNTLENKGVE